MNMDEMEKAIDHETETYKKIAFKNIFSFPHSLQPGRYTASLCRLFLFVEDQT